MLEGQYDFDLTPLQIEEDESNEGPQILKASANYNKGKYEESKNKSFSAIAQERNKVFQKDEKAIKEKDLRKE